MYIATGSACTSSLFTTPRNPIVGRDVMTGKVQGNRKHIFGLLILSVGPAPLRSAVRPPLVSHVSQAT